MKAGQIRWAIVGLCLAMGGCATSRQQAATTCLAQAHSAAPDEEPTTQGHDRAQEIMGHCMEGRGYAFDWSRQACDRQYPTTIVSGRCYRRP